MLSQEAQLIALVSNERMEKSDAIVCLEGDDGYIRIQKAFELFQNKLAPLIVVSGGVRLPLSLPAEKMAGYLLKKGLKKNNIILESVSQNTRQQALEVMKIVKEKKLKKIILVASTFHQPRAFLTFLKAAKDYHVSVKILNAPAEHSWFDKTKLGKSRLKLLLEEFDKIKEYYKKGHLVSIKEAMLYQSDKELIAP